MSLTIILSGPKFCENQARNALAARGYQAAPPSPFNHGLPDMATGDDPVQPQSFVTVYGDDVDAANAAVVSLGWGLRMHYDTPPDAEPSIDLQVASAVADLQRQIDELRAVVNGV